MWCSCESDCWCACLVRVHMELGRGFLSAVRHFPGTHADPLEVVFAFCFDTMRRQFVRDFWTGGLLHEIGMNVFPIPQERGVEFLELELLAYGDFVAVCVAALVAGILRVIARGVGIPPARGRCSWVCFELLGEHDGVDVASEGWITSMALRWSVLMVWCSRHLGIRAHRTGPFAQEGMLSTACSVFLLGRRNASKDWVMCVRSVVHSMLFCAAVTWFGLSPA